MFNYLRTPKMKFAGVMGAGLALVSATAALAISVLLPPGATVPVPATTAATEPDLSGVVLHDALVPFSIKAPSGAVLCSGNLQDRAVRSTKTGKIDFYYRIRDTQGPGALNRIITSSFGGTTLSTAYRTDGLGTVQPITATRSPAPGAVVVFTFSDPTILCARHQESRFILLKTQAATFTPGGMTRIFTTTGAQAVVPTIIP